MDAKEQVQYGIVHNIVTDLDEIISVLENKFGSLVLTKK